MNYPGAKNTNRIKSDSIELEKPSLNGSISSFAKDTTQKIGEGFTDMGKGIFDQILGNYPQEKDPRQEQIEQYQKQQEQPKVRLEGGNLFNYRSLEDERQINEIKELLKQIKEEIKMIKQADSALAQEVKDIEKVTLEEMPEKQGIYHIRLLQVFLKVLQQIRLKINESRTWMEAFSSKKAKRGSAFAARSKKSGTSYSMSQEISNARSVQ